MSNYGLSETEVRVIKEQASRRATMRQEYWKQKDCPFTESKGGLLFDPALQRFFSMRVTQLEHFKHTPKTAYYGLLLTVIPMTIYALLLKTDRDYREDKIRTGKVAYKDREGKIM